MKINEIEAEDGPFLIIYFSAPNGTEVVERQLKQLKTKKNNVLEGSGGGGGQVITVLTFYSVDPCTNPAEAQCFSSVNCLKIKKLNKKRPGFVHF